VSTTLGPGQFYGQVTEKRRCANAILSEFVHSEPKRLPRHTHELAYFCLLLDGQYLERFSGKSIVYQPYSIVFHPPGFTHRDEIGPEGGRFFGMELQSEWMETMRSHSSRLDASPDLYAGEMAWLAIRLYREYRLREAGLPLVIESLLTEMLVLGMRETSHAGRQAPSWLNRIVEKLRAEFDQNLSLAELATEAGVHPVHLSKVFRKHERLGIGEYVHRLRVQFALRELQKPGAVLADISAAAGFADQSHLTRVFKQITGVPPGAFRRDVLRG
jgi:AraC family transcriptional regulator